MMNHPNNRFTLISLGCPKNRVDSERILGHMTASGFEFVQDPGEAGVILINTCSFIEPAVEESVNTILDYSSEFPNALLVVTGCLPLRYGDQLYELLPEVIFFVTPERTAQIPAMIRERSGDAKKEKVTGYPCQERILTTPGYAFLKIAEGCSRKCSYCTIPSIRGPLRSVGPDQLEKEATMLAESGARELILVAQDLTSYGKDWDDKNALRNLLRRLCRIKNLEWIRLMYLHPNGLPMNLPAVMAESEIILPYLDIPFQHVSDRVLKAMGRPWQGDNLRKLVDRLRQQIKGLIIRTTVMVGFPTETDSDFKELAEFVHAFQLDYVGVFTYSPEEGTRAQKLGDPVPANVKEYRASELRSLQSQIINQRNSGRVGTVVSSIIEGVSDESELLLQGRTWFQAPEIDGILYITSGRAVAGDIHSVRITDFHGPDLFGEIVS